MADGRDRHSIEVYVRCFRFEMKNSTKVSSKSMPDLALQNNRLGKVSHRQWNRGKHLAGRGSLGSAVAR